MGRQRMKVGIIGSSGKRSWTFLNGIKQCGLMNKWICSGEELEDTLGCFSSGYGETIISVMLLLGLFSVLKKKKRACGCD